MSALALVAVVITVKVVLSGLGAGSTLDTVENVTFIDAETGQAFRCKLTAGMHFPVTSPYTGRNTGYPAELCYWTKDGQPKTDPTPVLLNSYLRKSGPTFCPDCGRLVVPNNPVASPGRQPPPTLAEWKASHPDVPIDQ